MRFLIDNQLTEQCTHVNRHRLQGFLKQYPDHNQVLLMIAEHHLPLAFTAPE